MCCHFVAVCRCCIYSFNVFFFRLCRGIVCMYAGRSLINLGRRYRGEDQEDLRRFQGEAVRSPRDGRRRGRQEAHVRQLRRDARRPRRPAQGERNNNKK